MSPPNRACRDNAVTALSSSLPPIYNFSGVPFSRTPHNRSSSAAISGS